MKNFNNRGGDRGGFRSGGDRGFRGGNRGGFGGGRDGRKSFGDRPQMHKTTCSECGNMAEVPFKPTGDKPVLCSNCFGGGDRDNRSRGNDRGGRDRGFGDKPRSSHSNTGVDFSKIKEEMSALNAKLDTLIGLIKKDSHVEISKTESAVESPKKVPKREKPEAGELTSAVKKAVKSEKKTTKKVAKKTAKKKK